MDDYSGATNVKSISNMKNRNKYEADILEMLINHQKYSQLKYFYFLLSHSREIVWEM